ncbi:hypothetical protein HYC85_010507 [Camellia sinensis]|uniref:Uncharacterized protein n=1 Tax=Camellia sinensis TaxID=4442 RepID=A0A7J7HI89_CAMSI|nr:hypothetical protein HYC85_010507 [Camellia sinensis]
MNTFEHPRSPDQRLASTDHDMSLMCIICSCSSLLGFPKPIFAAMEVDTETSPCYFDPEDLSTRERFCRYGKRHSTSSHDNSVSKFSGTRILYDGQSIERRPNAALFLEDIKQEVESFDADQLEGTPSKTQSALWRKSLAGSRGVSEADVVAYSICQPGSYLLKSCKHEDDALSDGGDSTFTLFASLHDSALQGLMPIPNLILQFERSCRNVSESISQVEQPGGMDQFKTYEDAIDRSHGQGDGVSPSTVGPENWSLQVLNQQPRHLSALLQKLHSRYAIFLFSKHHEEVVGIYASQLAHHRCIDHFVHMELRLNSRVLSRSREIKPGKYDKSSDEKAMVIQWLCFTPPSTVNDAQASSAKLLLRALLHSNILFREYALISMWRPTETLLSAEDHGVSENLREFQNRSEYYSCDATYRNWLKVELENVELRKKQRAIAAAKETLNSSFSLLLRKENPWLVPTEDHVYESVDRLFLELHATVMLCLPSGECMCSDATLCATLMSALYSSVSEEVVLNRQLMVCCFLSSRHMIQRDGSQMQWYISFLKTSTYVMLLIEKRVSVRPSKKLNKTPNKSHNSYAGMISSTFSLNHRSSVHAGCMSKISDFFFFLGHHRVQGLFQKGTHIRRMSEVCPTTKKCEKNGTQERLWSYPNYLELAMLSVSLLLGFHTTTKVLKGFTEARPNVHLASRLR